MNSEKLKPSECEALNETNDGFGRNLVNLVNLVNIEKLENIDSNKIECNMFINDLQEKNTKATSTIDNKTTLLNTKTINNTSNLSENDELTTKCLSNPNKELQSSKESLYKLFEECAIHKQTANNYFKERKIDLALKEYYKAVDVLSFNSTCNNREASDGGIQCNLFLTSLADMKIECLVNISVCYLILKQYESVLQITNKIIHSSFSVYKLKCYIIRSKAYQSMGNFTKELESLKKAYRIKSSENLLRKIEQLEEKILKTENNINFDFDKLINPYMNSNLFYKIYKICSHKFLIFLQEHYFISFLIFLFLFYEFGRGISRTLKNLQIKF